MLCLKITPGADNFRELLRPVAALGLLTSALKASERKLRNVFRRGRWEKLSEIFSLNWPFL